VLECVLNVSEGRDPRTLQDLSDAAGPSLLDLHRDPHHHRAVLTLVGEDAPRAVATRAVELLDLGLHVGVHPRLGVVDVVPFVPLAGSGPDDAIAARNAFATWFAGAHGVPCFLYGPERSLPDVRRTAFASLPPDVGPATPHPTAGATAVGSRSVLVAYNVRIDPPDLRVAQWLARTCRGPGIRALGLQVGEGVQVSMNLIDPEEVGPADAYDLVARLGGEVGAAVVGTELVGLLPASVLERVPRDRWDQLDLSEDRTIEARLSERAS
jgi:glutamate formiminotransferase / 5-formyltetrahydrofolate cyclo-ligase